jgi:hypothetical protein|mmetsp:Transcript_1227/g.2112  ORF Transcript_1227/g.2112 Transcript_1227/m.2112 type:complete len:274 (-) Transcript_1227:424-1245(-)
MCSFVASFATEFNEDSSTPCLLGDFYNESGDVTRGVTLPPCLCVHAEKDAKFDRDNVPADLDGWRFFMSDDIAPELSKDVAEYLSVTTMQLVDTTVTCANKLISFFERVVISRISKINFQKFTIRAEVIVSGMSCETKVRIYREGAVCFVEFQKRAGCAIAFNKVFDLAKEYLQCPGTRQADADTSALLQLDTPIASPLENTLLPLFNIISHSRNVDNLAEVASSLAEAVKNPEIRAQMHMPCALSALQELQQVEDFRVAYPTSQVLAWCALA